MNNATNVLLFKSRNGYVVLICIYSFIIVKNVTQHQRNILPFKTIAGRFNLCFLIIYCTFWRSRKSLSSSPKLSCGFKLVSIHVYEWDLFVVWKLSVSAFPPQLTLAIWTWDWLNSWNSWFILIFQSIITIITCNCEMFVLLIQSPCNKDDCRKIVTKPIYFSEGLKLQLKWCILQRGKRGNIWSNKICTCVYTIVLAAEGHNCIIYYLFAA